MSVDLATFIEQQRLQASNEVDLADRILDKNLDQCERLVARLAAQAVIKGAEAIMQNPTVAQ